MIVRYITMKKSRERISFNFLLLSIVVLLFWRGGWGPFVTMGVDWQDIQAERNNVSIERYLSEGGMTVVVAR